MQYLEGLREHMGQMIQNFVHVHQLQPVKIVLMGPPASGKSALAQHLAAQYSLPVLTAADILAAASLLPQDEQAAVKQALAGGGGKKGAEASGRLPAQLMSSLCRCVFLSCSLCTLSRCLATATHEVWHVLGLPSEKNA